VAKHYGVLDTIWRNLIIVFRHMISTCLPGI
jgi:hypothetical protein